MTQERETEPRAPGCVCTYEQGDSDCPVHVCCSECGADISHQRVVASLQKAKAELLASRAECERLKEDRDEWKRGCDQLRVAVGSIAGERDAANAADIERWRKDRDDWKECAARTATERRSDEMRAIHEANRMRPVYEAALAWRRAVQKNPWAVARYEAPLVDAIDALDDVPDTIDSTRAGKAGEE